MTGPSPPTSTPPLAADCNQCAALCCVLLPFGRSADFAFDKPAGVTCRHLVRNRCGVHAELLERGMSGCVSFDCFGAGQRVTALFAEPDEPTAVLIGAFAVMRRLHEMLWYLREADEKQRADSERATVRQLREQVEILAARPGAELANLDLAPVHESVASALAQASAAVRSHRWPGGRDRRNADLAGAALRGHTLAGWNLRGAVLVGADLRETDLCGADLLGADLRGARVHGAALAEALFVTQAQLNAAEGDEHGTVPSRLRRPEHWSAASSAGTEISRAPG